MNTTNLHIPSNKVCDIERYIQQELKDLYPAGELRMFTNMLFEAFLGWDRVHLMLNRDHTINQSDLLKFHWAVEDLKQYRPIQHIIGFTEFCGLKIDVDTHVLIPRPETEEIIGIVSQEICRNGLENQNINILDICTGSGCIALALKNLYPNSNVYGLDISDEALEVAKNNADQLGLDVSFLLCDILQTSPNISIDQFDLIISNPPYIRQQEQTDMSANVLNYEPRIALFVPNQDPLLFYRAIGQFAIRHLSTRGILAFEINENLGLETCELLKNLGFDSQLHKDFRDKPRCIISHKK